MTNEQIEKFLKNNEMTSPVQINFKARNSIKGIFIKTADFSELKSKNLWRIVSESKFEDYEKSKDINLARIFSGMEITKLGVV